MKYLKNEDGIALITALMLTMLSLVIVMALLYFVTQNIQMSAGSKRYRTALEASNGGVDLLTKDIIPRIFQGYSSSLSADFASVGLQTSTNNCLNQKLTLPPSQWSSVCSNTMDPKSAPDISFVLRSSIAGFSPQPGFRVFTKIVDTVVGNSDTSGVQLEGGGVAEGTTTVTPMQKPYLYRIEVQGEREINPSERAALSVLYAY